MSDNYLICPDTQIPFHAKNTIPFLKRVQKEFRVPSGNVLHAGDESDQFYLSKYPKNPDMRLSAIEEFEESAAYFKEFYRAFPSLRLCYSNHGVRPLKRLLEAGIPSIYLKSYAELIEAPKSWLWARRWVIKQKHPWCIEHGTKYSGVSGHRTAALNNGMSTVIGHLHSYAGVEYLNREVGGLIWAANAGCLIDRESLAFEYGSDSKFLPVNGCVVVVDNGATPIFVPMHE